MSENTGNRQQQRDLGRVAKKRWQRYVRALREVLSTPEGRLVFGELEHGLIAKCGVYRSIWDSSARIHYNAGRQDLGHEILSLVADVDEELYLQMEREARALARQDKNEVAAVLTPSSTEGEN
jgi:hypothetical protein